MIMCAPLLPGGHESGRLTRISLFDSFLLLSPRSAIGVYIEDVDFFIPFMQSGEVPCLVKDLVFDPPPPHEGGARL